MSAFLFGRLSRHIPAIDIRPGNRYRRQLGNRLVATATMLDLRSDLMGIPDVHFSTTVDGSAARLSEVTRGSWPSNPSSILSRASRTGSPTRSKWHRAGDADPIIAQTISNLNIVTLVPRAYPRRRLRHDKRNGLQSSDHTTRAP